MPHRHRRVTIKDVVAETGLSLGTVSGVLNNANGFAEDTRRKVLAAARRLNYAPDLRLKSARRAVGSNGKTLTNVIVHVTFSPPSNPYEFDPFLACRELLFVRLAAEIGYNVIPLFYDEAKAFACPPAMNGQVDGAIAGMPHPDICAAFEGHVPLVLMDVPFSLGATQVPMVNFDIRYGMHEIARHLAGLGHRRVGALFFNKEVPHNLGSRCPFLAVAAAAAGIELDATLSRDRRLSPATHEKVMDEFVGEAIPLIRTGSVTALLMVSDELAGDLIRRLAKAGISVPGDVSVTGFGSSPLLRWNVPESPTLTSVEFPWGELTKAALELLRSSILGGNTSVGELLIRPTLVPGETLRGAAETGRRDCQG